MIEFLIKRSHKSLNLRFVLDENENGSPGFDRNLLYSAWLTPLQAGLGIWAE